MVEHSVHMAFRNLVAALEDVAWIDMCYRERMEVLAAVNFQDLVVDMENLVAAPKCTFASDYVGK